MIGWDELKMAVGGVYDFYEVRREAVSPTGGRVIFKTLDDPDSARGFTFHGAILDEASLIKEAAWYEVIRPTLSDTHGWLLAMFTPKGHNWVWRESIEAADRTDSEAWQAPTLGVEIVNEQLIRKPHPLENPFFSFDEALNQFHSMPRRIFEQEFLAQFMADSGAVFRNVEQVAILEIPESPDAHKDHYITIGVDWAKYNDFTVLTAYCADCRRVVDWDRFNQIDFIFQRKRLGAMVDKWQNAPVLPERNSIGVPNIELLLREEMPVLSGSDGEAGFNTSAQTKPELIEDLSLAIERGTLKVPREYRDELVAYEILGRNEYGKNRYGAPEGMHDDRVMSLALAYRAGNAPQAAGDVIENVEYSIFDG